MNLTEAADYVHIVSIDPNMHFTPARRARLGEVEDAMRAAVAPEVVAAAFDLELATDSLDLLGEVTVSRILKMLAEHGLKVVRA